MFHVPKFYPDISMKLSRVLEETGVNKRMLRKRRRTWLLIESLNNITDRLRGFNMSSYNFGSQSEGTTTQGLHSDTDKLICNHSASVIQDWSEWEEGLLNVLMIQEETTPPGYCMLQYLHDNEPTAGTEIPNEQFGRYRGDKILLKNTVLDRVFTSFGTVKNGPAATLEGSEGFPDEDYAVAISFKRSPVFFSTWLQQQTQHGKLSQDMKRYMEANPCYVVPAGKKNSSFQETEWRLSTSHAERCIMLNLNVTQLQCYIMLKLLLKTHLKHPKEKALSSFMCKNILIRCIEKTHFSNWRPQNLLAVFTIVLLQIKQSIIENNCPHFIIYENNLMAQTFTVEVKSWLLEKIQLIYEIPVLAFLDIGIDDIGNRLTTQLNTKSHDIFVRDIAHDQSRNISGELVYNFAALVSRSHRFLLTGISGINSFISIITELVQLNHHGSDFEQAASRLLTPLICSSQGSVIASRDIYNNHSVSHEALTWLSLGLNSDVASSRLKLASVYYCIGDFHTTETILSNIEDVYDRALVHSVCDQHDQGRFWLSAKFKNYSNTRNELSIRHSVAYCVRFTLQEVHCQPTELQYEVFRSTLDNRVQRNGIRHYWINWAEVDSLPYLYFLQYKTYGNLQRYDEQRQALNNLVISIYTTLNLRHKETAWNLLGQCYKQENRHTEALHCYMNSLRIRPTNNAAKLHICLLLYAIYTNRQSMQ